MPEPVLAPVLESELELVLEPESELHPESSPDGTTSPSSSSLSLNGSNSLGDVPVWACPPSVLAADAAPLGRQLPGTADRYAGTS